MTDRRSEQQASSNDETAADERILGALKDLHTALPGVIVKFDAVTQTAQVQPLIKRIFYDKGAVNLPVCVDVPVHFPKAGGYCLTFPVKPGDECILCFFERAIDNWFANGGVQEPSEFRLHDLSDGYAIVGISNSRATIPQLSTTDVELRTLNRASRVSIKADGSISNVTPNGSTLLTAAGKFTITAPAGFEVIAPTSTMSGTATIAGLVTGNGGATVNGATVTNGTLVNNGKDVGGTHVHVNTQPLVGGFSGVPA